MEGLPLISVFIFPICLLKYSRSFPIELRYVISIPASRFLSLVKMEPLPYISGFIFFASLLKYSRSFSIELGYVISVYRFQVF